MAQGKTRSSNPRSNSGSGSTRPKGARAKSNSRPGATGNRSRSRSSNARQTRAKRATQVGSAGKPAGGTAKRAVDATAEKAGAATKRAKGPALAAGAAAAGLAGGFLLGARQRSRRKVFGIAMPRGDGFKSAAGDVLKAAEKVGSAGRQLGALADEVERTRQTIEHSRKSSPIEVVRHALTHRPGGKRRES
jgi:hypothetical protein